MTRRLSTVLPVLAMCLLASCAPFQPQPGEPVSQDVAEQLISDWQADASRIRTVQGLAKVKVKAPMNNVNGTQVVLAEKPNKLRAETISPFGPPILTLTADGDQIGVSLPAQNLYYIGRATADNLGLFVHIPLQLADLVGVLLYQPPLIDAWRQEAFALEAGGWLLIRRGATHRQELTFNAMRQLVGAAYFADNDLIIRIGYAELARQAATGAYPKQLSLELPEKHATISLTFTDVETNGLQRAGIFDVLPPAGAKVVYLPE